MNYERGLAQMKQRLQGTTSYQELLLFEVRLHENLQSEQHYGTNEQIRSDRARILEQLNRLALEHLHISFNDVCVEEFSGASPADEGDMTAAPSKPAIASPKAVFIGYSNKDRKYAEELHTHLAHAGRKGTIHVWDYTKILPGSKWQEEINTELRASSVAVLLISADFFASDFIAEYELPYLLAAAEHKQLTILCVIVRPCTFASSELATFQTVNTPNRPLSAMSQAERETIWVKVATLTGHA